MLNNLLQEELQERRENFTVDSLESANWCFRKLRALKEKQKENNSLSDAEIQRIEAWRTKENASVEQSIEYFESLLKDYYKRLKAENPKTKLSTPYGKVSSKKTNKWNYQNEEKTLKYLTSNGFQDLIKVKPELNKKELKTLFKNGVNTETGECIPGIEVTPEESINISVE